MNHSQKILPDWIIVTGGSIIIMILGIIMTNGLSEYMDILLSDETFYLSYGLDFFDKVPKGWGPSYCGWYKMLSLIEPDPIQLYYLNFKVLAITLSILIFLCLYRFKVNIFIAFVSGLFFLYADINMISWPRVSHFAAAGLLLALFLSTFLKSGYLKLLLFLFAGIMMTYARPEIRLPFTLLLLFVIGFITFYRKFRLTRPEWIATLIIIPVFFALFLKAGNPVLPPKGKANFQSTVYPRQITAYGQHFYLRYMEENGLLQDSLIYWDQIFREYYEPHFMLVQTLRTNVPATIHHISYNTRKFLERSFDYTSGIFLPDKILYLSVWLKFSLFICSLIAIIAISGWKTYRSRIRDSIKEYYPEYLLVLLFSGLPVLTSLIIYPRDHYLIMLMPAYILLVSMLYLIHIPKKWNRKIVMAMMVALGILMVFIQPKASELEYFHLWQPRTGTVNLDAIQTINEMGIDRPYTILNNEGLMDVFLDNEEVYAHMAYGNMHGFSFLEAMDTLNIRMVHFTSFLDHDPGMVYDTTWTNFLAHPELLNFERVETGNPYGYLLVHESILNK